MIRWLLTFAVAYWCLDQSMALWAEFGDWADPYTWLIWFWPVPLPLQEKVSC